jgi:hypothetical protein
LEGWISIHRRIWDNWTWEDRPFSKGQAWIDLLLLANFTDVKIPYKGEIITCKRGDVNRSIQELSTRWGWSRKKTRAYLNLLENDKMVTVKATTHRTTITIEKYNDYQDKGTTKGTTKEQQRNSKGTAKEQQAPINNKDNKVNNDNNDNKKEYAEFVRLKETEYNSLLEKHGELITRQLIETLNNFKGAKGATYKSDYHAILKWVVDSVTKQSNTTQQPNQQQKPINRNTKFHYGNATSRTSQYSAADLEEVAKRKREQYRRVTDDANI